MQRYHISSLLNSLPFLTVFSFQYVNYGRITRDLAILTWTSASSLIRRYYLIKVVECYAETLGITLGQVQN